MTKLTQFLEGKISVQDFSKALQNDPALQSEVRNIGKYAPLTHSAVMALIA